MPRPLVSPSDQTYLQQLKTLFLPLFNRGDVAQLEWQAVYNNTQSIGQLWQTVLTRLHIQKQTAAMHWENPVHVVAQLRQYREIFNYHEAVALLPKAYSEYIAIFKRYLTGNYTLVVEMDHKVVNSNGMTLYSLHAHIICETAAYNAYKKITPYLRRGRNLVNHILTTRSCPKTNAKQSWREFVNRVTAYITKFPVLKSGNSRNRKAQILPHSIAEYLQSYKHKIYLNVEKIAIKPSKIHCSLRTIYKTAKQLYKQWRQEKTNTKTQIQIQLRKRRTIRQSRRLLKRVIVFRKKLLKNRPVIGFNQLVRIIPPQLLRQVAYPLGAEWRAFSDTS